MNPNRRQSPRKPQSFRPEVTALEARLTPASPNFYGYTATSTPFLNLLLREGDPGVNAILRSGNFVAGQGDDDSTNVDLNGNPILGANHFRFFGGDYTNTDLNVCTNGFLTFNNFDDIFINDNLAAGGFTPTTPTIAPFWDDLQKFFGDNTSGPAMILDRFDDLNADTIPDRLIIQWTGVSHYSTNVTDGPVTFQAILQVNTGAADGDIIFNYVSTTFGNGAFDGGLSATVGIKNDNLINPGGGFQQADALMTWFAEDGTIDPLNTGDVPIQPVDNSAILISAIPPGGKLTGHKYEDVNDNGVYDPGTDRPVAGFVFFADADGDGQLDPGERFATSDATGAYTIQGLAPGTYHVVEQLQPGWIQIGNTAGNVTIVGTETQNGGDFLNFHLGSIHGAKFNDLNGDGVRETGEPGIQNWQIQLTNLDTGAQTTVLTDVNGNYSFDNLARGGHFRVREIQQAGWVQTTANPPDLTVVGSGASVTADFGNFKTFSISGFKFHDLNQDGIKQANEPFISGWRFYLDLNGNGVADASEPVAVTNNTGRFTFSNLGPRPAGYLVREIPVYNWHQTTANPAAVPATSGVNVDETSFGFAGLAFGNRRYDTLVTGNGSGLARVNVYDVLTGTMRLQLNPFEASYVNGVQVADVDLGFTTSTGAFVNGLDGIPEILVAPNAGRLAEVLVYDGQTGRVVRRFQPFGATYTGGLSLAVGDVTGDGHSDVVVGAFNGQARVAVIDVFNNVVRTPFLAFESGFNGGARVAVADLSGTGRNQIIVGAGAGRSADVRIYNVSATGQGTLARSITAFAGSTAGVWVTADTGRIIVGDGGGVPEVRIFNPSTGARIGSFYPYTAQQSPHGVRVALTDRNFDGVNEIVTAPGAGGAPFVRFWNLTTFQEYAALSYFAYQDTMTGGVFLGGSRRAV